MNPIAKVVAASALAASSVVVSGALVDPEPAEAYCSTCFCFVGTCTPTNSFCAPTGQNYTCSVDGGVCFNSGSFLCWLANS